MNKAIENFNYDLQLLSFQIDQNSLESGNYVPPQLNPPITDLTIYYPISRYDEFDPIPVTYNIPTGIRPIDILGAIYTFYDQPLRENNILAYMGKNAEVYGELLDDILAGKQVKLRDVMFGRIHVESLHPYERGYELMLGS
jgi:hypothetical protein